jgi:hypothetical protein
MMIADESRSESVGMGRWVQCKKICPRELSVVVGFMKV